MSGTRGALLARVIHREASFENIRLVDAQALLSDLCGGGGLEWQERQRLYLEGKTAPFSGTESDEDSNSQILLALSWLHTLVPSRGFKRLAVAKVFPAAVRRRRKRQQQAAEGDARAAERERRRTEARQLARSLVDARSTIVSTRGGRSRGGETLQSGAKEQRKDRSYSSDDSDDGDGLGDAGDDDDSQDAEERRRERELEILPSPQELLLLAAQEWYGLWASFTEETLTFKELETAVLFFGDKSLSSSSAAAAAATLNNSGELEMLSQTACAAQNHMEDSIERARVAAASASS